MRIGLGVGIKQNRVKVRIGLGVGIKQKTIIGFWPQHATVWYEACVVDHRAGGTGFDPHCCFFSFFLVVAKCLSTGASINNCDLGTGAAANSVNYNGPTLILFVFVLWLYVRTIPLQDLSLKMEIQNSSDFDYFMNPLELMDRVEKRFDEKQAIAWMNTHWTWSFVFSTVYIILVFGGQRFMKDRKPFDLRRELCMWSTGLSIFRWGLWANKVFW